MARVVDLRRAEKRCRRCGYGWQRWGAAHWPRKHDGELGRFVHLSVTVAPSSRFGSRKCRSSFINLNPLIRCRSGGTGALGPVECTRMAGRMSAEGS